jgi:hypothetical protein
MILDVEMNITDSTFLNGNSLMGDAIYMSGLSTLNIKRSQFSNNYASNSGDVMYFRGFNQVKITDQTKLKANHA